MTEKQNPALAPTSGPGIGKTSSLNPNSKNASVLRAFLSRGERGMNCFQAVSVCHDYVLRTTVSVIHRRYGITFDRKWEQVPGHNGSSVACVRYWVAPESIQDVRHLLGGGETRREGFDEVEGRL